MNNRFRLGDALLKMGLINEVQLDAALKQQQHTGQKLGSILVEQGLIAENQLSQQLAKHLNMPFIDLQQLPAHLRLSTRLKEVQARAIHAVALEEENGRLTIAFSDPTDLPLQDKLPLLLKQPLQYAVSSKQQVLKALDQLYAANNRLQQLAGELNQQLPDSRYDLEDMTQTATAEDAPVMQLLQSILVQAIRLQASDLHLEPDEHLLRIRLRVDGLLQEQVFEQKRIANALIVRIKLLAGMNISEKRLPQDGRASLRVNQHQLDLRIATLPTIHGESLVIRILDQSLERQTLADLGLSAAQQGLIKELLHQPQGLLLVTGPTGSGKTTSLYACLGILNESKRKIISIEDPIEYRVSRVNQVQTNPQLGLDFPQILRSALRQDPDVVMIGEMRDQTTAAIGLSAALTGHLVLSSLHTNNAISTVLRLADMGIEGWLAAGALKAILAQRLVRKLCPHCKQGYSINSHELGIQLPIALAEQTSIRLHRAHGCPACQHTGYQGRQGVHELLVLNAQMLDAVRQQDYQRLEQLCLADPNFQDLAQAGLQLLLDGTIDLMEMKRLLAFNPETKISHA